MEEQLYLPDASAFGVRASSGFEEIAEQLAEYFAGKRRTFTLRTQAAGTDFQRRIWHTLSTIPYGETWTYTQLAAAVGRPDAVRAAGAANGKNPISIVVPCHRVVGSNGSLTGYAGGLARKRFLLDLEGAPGPPQGSPC